VTVCDYANKERVIFKDETKIKLIDYINEMLNKSEYVCDQINHANIAYGNDGPFIDLYNIVTKKYIMRYTILLNLENDTFRHL